MTAVPISKTALVVVALSVGVIIGLFAAEYGGGRLSPMLHKGKPCGRSWIAMDKTCHKPMP